VNHRLADSAPRFQNRGSVIHDARQIGISECNTAERIISQDFTRPKLSICAEKEAGLRA
jgi:hypothetical protein